MKPEGYFFYIFLSSNITEIRQEIWKMKHANGRLDWHFRLTAIPIYLLGWGKRTKHYSILLQITVYREDSSKFKHFSPYCWTEFRTRNLPNRKPDYQQLLETSSVKMWCKLSVGKNEDYGLFGCSSETARCFWAEMPPGPPLFMLAHFSNLKMEATYSFEK
jgi:hypothetical protein